ncbi:MAG: hypothetical protein RLY16_1346 [Bacteroidota bacterium]|jgi:hypothetical protein
MGLVDLILFPFYVLLFHLIFSARRKKIEDPILKKYHRNGFWIKVISCVAFTFFNVYLSIGDSVVLYYDEGNHFKDLVFKDFSHIGIFFSDGKDYDPNLLYTTLNTGYFANDGNFFTARLVGVLSFFCFGSYFVINLCFSLISFSGVWRLFRFFYELYPTMHRKLAIAIIYMPTFVFWSSGILKDPICTGMMGFLTYGLYNLVVKRQHILKNTLVVLLSAYVLGIVKSYILVSYLPFTLLFVLLLRFKQLKSAVSRLALIFSLILMGVGGSFLVADRMQEELGNLAFDKISESVKVTQNNFINMADLAESSFSLGVDFDGSPASMAKMAPLAVNATLFRPYLWESKKASTLLSSLESLALMVLTLYALIQSRVVGFFKTLFTNAAVFYCFFFAILFALFVGATALNFGTLVRYKIPCMPFYIIALFLIVEQYKQPQKKEVEP